MKRMICLVACFAIFSALSGCASKHEEIKPVPNYGYVSNVKIKVADVSNNTTELFDVDVIGMLWNSLEDSLKKRGMLWKGDLQEKPLILEAHVTKYQKGSVWLRPCLPLWGRTILEVKAELKEEGRVIATAEAKQKITLGSGTFTRDAYKKVFGTVSEDIINQVAMKR
jgi:hypothetical protein